MCVHVIFKATEHANNYVLANLNDIFQFPKRNTKHFGHKSFILVLS